MGIAAFAAAISAYGILAPAIWKIMLHSLRIRKVGVEFDSGSFDPASQRRPDTEARCAVPSSLVESAVISAPRKVTSTPRPAKNLYLGEIHLTAALNHLGA
jgi:hypothetical protein